jgi:3-oxoadipate enol-lactonase
MTTSSGPRPSLLTRSAHRTLTPTDRIQLTSGALHVESNGDPLGRLILCVHGLSANCRSFDRFVPVLAGAGHHVVTMDLRGRGRSEITPPGTYGWDSHVRDLLEIAENYGADSFDVIGHSMGGFIGMSLAAQYPRRCSRLVLLDALDVPEPGALLSITKSISRLGRTYQSAPAVLAYMKAAGSIAPWDAFWDSYFAWELEQVEDTVRIRTDSGAVSEDSVYATTHDVYGLWSQLRCPVLLVRASRPMAPGGGLVVSQTDTDRFAAEARDARVVDVDTDHYSILISPPAVSAVERFLGAVAP